MSPAEARAAVIWEWELPYWEQSSKRFEEALDVYVAAVKEETAYNITLDQELSS